MAAWFNCSIFLYNMGSLRNKNVLFLFSAEFACLSSLFQGCYNYINNGPRELEFYDCTSQPLHILYLCYISLQVTSCNGKAISSPSHDAYI